MKLFLIENFEFRLYKIFKQYDRQFEHYKKKKNKKWVLYRIGK